MANNLMFLVHKQTGERIVLAKYYPSTGWYCSDDLGQKLGAFFDAKDFGHLSEQERADKVQQSGFGQPYAAGGMYGADWALEYAVDD